MSFNAHGSVSRRNNPFTRASPGPSPGPQTGSGVVRPKSTIFSSTPPVAASSTPSSHIRSYSRDSPAYASASASTPIQPTAPLAPRAVLAPSPDLSIAPRRHSRDTSKHGSVTSGTFAPAFIKTEDMRRSPDPVSGIEGENDFSGKRYVWLKDPQQAFVKGWIIEDLENNRIRVQYEDGKVSELF